MSHRKNVASQFGEDGVLQQVFKIVPIAAKPWCIEFGAGDGKFMSNTWNLITHKGWRAVLIEADRRRYERLLVTHQKSLKRIVAVNEFVTFSGRNSLDGILSRARVPKDVDFLSIDIDGNDYHIWDALRTYAPKVVIIEFNPSIPQSVDFVQPRDMNVRQGTSLAALVRLGKSKGYELVYAHDGNAIFVQRRFFPAFGIADNSIAALYSDHKYETQVYQLFDGTMRYEGCDRLIWLGVQMQPKRLQVLPRYLRGFDKNGRMIIIFIMRFLRVYKPHITFSELVGGKVKTVFRNFTVNRWKER